MFQLVRLLFRFLLTLGAEWLERTRYKREKKKKIRKEILSGIVKKDKSAITSGFDKLRRMH